MLRCKPPIHPRSGGLKTSSKNPSPNPTYSFFPHQPHQPHRALARGTSILLTLFMMERRVLFMLCWNPRNPTNSSLIPHNPNKIKQNPSLDGSVATELIDHFTTSPFQWRIPGTELQFGAHFQNPVFLLSAPLPVSHVRFRIISRFFQPN